MPEIVSLPKCLCKCRNNSSPISSDDSPSTRVFIKGLSLSTTEGYLTNAFSQFGKVDRVKVVTDRASKQSLGFAYIWFTCEEDAKLAVKKMDGKFFDGRFVHVTMAWPETLSNKRKATPYRF
ncbi:hypothetical protein AMTR_s00025p00095750 [Amborella trichopoda]|uniref:RRM domain-containing protein n=2 Tax=Amborella trichopoda TaxID=13333 RepID=W1PW65_AMBTC|nr:hypothetical protein AMTR_s00025p00095750 [Amborella trichopoda]